MRAIDINERRARLGLRHALARPAPDPVAAARAVLALHSSDPVTVYLSVLARVPGFEIEDLEKTLYTDRSLIRMFGMRRTLWVVDRATVPLVHHSSTLAIAERERRRNAELLERGGITDDGAAWLDETIPEVLAIVRERGEILTRDLTPLLARFDGKIEIYSSTGKLQGTTGIASRVVLQLAMESRLVRARPAGTWVSGQYRYADMSRWLGNPIPELDPGQASAGLLQEWLSRFGPATEADIKWWTGWNLSQVRAAREQIHAVEVELDGATGYVLPNDVDPVAEAEPWVAFLPSLDPTTMGWKERDWYVGIHQQTLFDRNGNAGPTVWVDGRVVGGWAQRKNGEVVYEIFDDVGSESAASIETAADDVQRWLGTTVVTPRFRSPHDLQLTA